MEVGQENSLKRSNEKLCKANKKLRWNRDKFDHANSQLRKSTVWMQNRIEDLEKDKTNLEERNRAHEVLISSQREAINTVNNICDELREEKADSLKI